MGRPINRKWFGSPVTPGSGHIKVNGVKWTDGTTSSNAYIVKQTGDRAYLVSNGTTKSEIVFLVNATGTGQLAASQCYILATPFGGSARPCEKIAQYRLSLYMTDGTIDDFVWSTIPATKVGEADLIL